MKRWSIAVVFSIVMIYPAVSHAAESFFSSGRETRFSFPLVKIPFGSAPKSDTPKEKEDASKEKEDPAPVSQEEREAKMKEEERAKIDKKIDDAIDKAWGRETPERRADTNSQWQK